MNVSYIALLVLREFLIATYPMCGAEIMRKVGGFGGGTMYPMLARFKTAGWIEHVETLAGLDEPPAHFYQITAVGRVQFLTMLGRLTISDHLWREPQHG